MSYDQMLQVAGKGLLADTSSAWFRMTSTATTAPPVHTSSGTHAIGCEVVAPRV